jgi:hypothetical protein
MGIILLGAIGAFLVNRRPQEQLNTTVKELPTGPLVGAGGKALAAARGAALQDALVPGAANAICGRVAQETTKYLGGTEAQVARVGGLSAAITQPVCWANVKAVEVGIDAGRSLYNTSRRVVSAFGSAVKGIF